MRLHRGYGFHLGDWSTLAGTEIDIVILQIMYITSKKEIKSPKDHIIYGYVMASSLSSKSK